MSNIFTKALAAGLGQIMERVTQMRHPGQSGMLQWLLKRTKINYRREVGDGLDSSVVTAPIRWLQRALPEAKLSARQVNADGSKEDIDNHDMLDLIQNPNPYYGDIALWGATILSLIIDGNAYWMKVRNSGSKVVELWWVPWWMMEPKATLDGSDFISHYEYTPGTGMGRMAIDPEEVVHFRDGINPHNMLKGISALDGVIREIFTDLEASNFVASLLRNMGVPGVVISPKGGAMPSTNDVEATKVWFDQAFGGDNRGKPMVMGAPTDVQQFGFDPQSMNLSEGRDVAEERVCAVIGVPAAVVGFGAGLQQTKVGATMEELRKLAWHNGVLPLGRQLIDELARSLLPDFQRGQAARVKVELYWNTDEVLALQEDENRQTDRKLKEFEAGAITHWQYLTETGREAEEHHRYYLRNFNKIVVPEAQAGASQLSHNGGPALTQESEPEEEVWCGDCGAKIKAGYCPHCDDDDPKGQKSLPAPQVKEQKNDNPVGPDWLPDDAVQASEAEIERGLVLVNALQRQQGGLKDLFKGVLIPTFEGWGDSAGRIARDVLRASGEKALLDGPTASLLEAGRKSTRLSETKSDNDIIRQIIELLNIEAWDNDLSSKYQAQYLAVAREVAAAIEQSGFATSIPDPVMRQIIADGGTRAGLIDLDDQTRKAIFQALAEGRAAGEGAQALANRIANQVEGGPRGTAEQRALMIARTETKHAQNISTVEAARANGVQQMIIFDGRFGEPRSELSHIARDGKIVSIDQARTMAENMRPNCTLSLAPHFAL